MSGDLRTVPLVRSFLRSFVVQGSWNYKTMLGTGFAYAILPALRDVRRAAPEGSDEAITRHSEHFNAHPYLTPMALGATIRMEADGSDPELIRRFKLAVRGPLGSLGDSLIWAGWLPTCSLIGLSLHWLGASPAVAVGAFLAVYNVGHLTLRVWGFRAGLRAGHKVASELARADLGKLSFRLGTVVALLAGVVTGLLLAGGTGLSGVPLLGLAGGAAVGGAVGHRAWRPAAAVTAGAMVLVAMWGMVS